MMKTTNNVADDFSCAPSIILKFNNHMLFYNFEMTRKKWLTLAIPCYLLIILFIIRYLLHRLKIMFFVILNINY